MTENNKIRNIAIIAHVDHGKTTLVDHMFKQSGLLRPGQELDDRVMDAMDLERERGITITAKNCAVSWGDTKINILDTPGHSDFGGEVERAISMVDGAILLVDSAEGPLPQTRFVLSKALEKGIPIIVAINKIDRADARPEEVLDEVYDLFIDLGASDEQIEFPVIYAIGRDGIAKKNLEDESSNLSVLFDAIVSEFHGPSHEPDHAFQMLVSNLDYSDYLGRLTIGKILNGSINKSDKLVRIDEHGNLLPLSAANIQVYDGMGMSEVTTADAGEIVILSGISDVVIGDTICCKENPVAAKRLYVDEPTVSMKFAVNTSPFAGKDGKFVQSRKIRERLYKETLHNVALQVEDSDDGESFTVKGRGEFQMAILIETMRREGFELTVGRPQIILKKEGEKVLEPIEHLIIDASEEFVGVITEKLATRKGQMTNLVNNGSGRVKLEFSIPSRGLIGYRNEFLTDTKGTGIMNSNLEKYEEYRGDIVSRQTGSMVCDREGEAVAYALFHLEPRGTLFSAPGDAVYKGMIVGEHNRPQDLHVNACKTKKLSNVRASGKDEAITLTPARKVTLETAIEFIKDDELLEVTPNYLRLRKSKL